MKKTITIMLSAIMVFTSLASMFIAPVSAATNLWSGLSASDWYTRQVQVEVANPLTLEEKKMTAVYPEKFTYGGGSFSLSTAGGKHYYIKMPVLAKNKEYTLSFNYSVTPAASGTPNLYKAIIMPESAFGYADVWNGFGAMMGSRGYRGSYDIYINHPLDSTELNGTVTYTFNTKTQAQYYLFLNFNSVDTVTYSNFKIVDPTDTTPDEEENPAEVWNTLSVDDWYTRDIDGTSPYDDGRNIPEKTVSERFGADFTYNANDATYNLKNAGGRHYYIKMPVLTKNKDYKLSFDYNVSPAPSVGDTTPVPTIYKILLVPKNAFTNQHCWQASTGEIYADRTFIGIQNIVGGNTPGILELTPATYQDTLTYDFNTGNYTDYYLYLMFNGISEITYSNFSIIDPELVQEETITTEWKSNEGTAVTAVADNEKGILAQAANPWYNSFYYKLAQVEKNTNYTLSFSYKAKPYTENGEFTNFKLATDAGFNNPICWNSGIALNGEMFDNRANYGVIDIQSKIAVDNTWTKFTYDFNSGDTTQFYFYIRTAHILELTLTDIKVEEKLESVIALPEDPADIWTEYSADDWFTRQVETAVDDGRNIPEKTMAEKYGADFSYNSETKSFSLKNAGGRYYYVKLPTMQKEKEYILSIDYLATLAQNKENKFANAILVPANQFNSEYCWKTTGEIWADRTFVDIYDVVGGKNDGLAPGGIVLNEENRNGNITYKFNSGKYTEYYVFFKFDNVKTVTYYNLSLLDSDLVIDDEPDEPIEVKPEDPADIWTKYSADDWFTRQVETAVDDGKNIPQKTMAEKYGADFSYNAETKSFKLRNAGGRYYYVKLPTLNQAKNYILSIDYLASLKSDKENLFTKAILVPANQFTNEFCWTTTGEIWSDRTFVDIYDIVGGKNDGLAPGGIVLTEENRNGNITYNFNSGKYTEYYVFFKFDNIKTVTYYNLSLIDTTLKPNYKGNPLNYGSITPSALPEGTKAGDTVEFTATPFKGNTFAGWYDGFGNIISTDITFAYTVPKSLEMPVPSFDTGAVSVPNASLEDSVKGLLAYYNKEDNFNKTIIDENYEVEYNGTPNWVVNIQAHTEHARTGEYSVKIQTPYAYSGRHFKGLKKNTDYAISFWAYIDVESGLSLNAMVLPKGVKPYKEISAGKIADYPLKEAMGVAEKAAIATTKWQEVVVKFNSGENTDVTLWFLSRGANSDRCWVDDFTIFEQPVSLEVVAGLGGSVTATQSGVLPKGTEVTVTATPNESNTFKHWIDENDKVISVLPEYTFTVSESTYLNAVFEGYNRPARELITLNGDDGTFEGGSISGIYAGDAQYPESLGHCKTSVSTAEAYEGKKSLEITSYYRNTIIPLTGLNKNTEYRFSYYVKYPYKGERDDWNQINSMAICGADDIDGATANKIFAQSTSYLAGDAGWYKVELYFNSGEDLAVNFIIRYAGEASLVPTIYMDNVELYEYSSSAEIANGSMENTIEPWLGDGEVTADNTLVLKGKNATSYQILGLGTHGRYTVKFRAKGNFFAAVSNVSAKVPNIYNALSSETYVQGNSNQFKEYFFEIYTGTHRGVALMFSSVDGDVYIDDVTITKELTAIGGVIENVDFESDRFALTHSDTEAYEIYTQKSAEDLNVHSGKKSLHFKYNAQKADVEYILDEAYLSYGVAYNHNYMLSLYYKYDSKTKETAINLEPNYRASYYNGDYGDYTGTIGYEQPATKGEWQQLRFAFTARDYGTLKAAIYNIIGKTDADFYVDDIKITVSSDLVVDENAQKAYATDFYNLFTNPSFEKSAEHGNWVGMPNSMKIVKNANLADTADSFLMVNAGTKYILPLELNPSEIYYFGASIRSFNGGKGRIYLATLVTPETLYFTDLENNPKSIITANGEGWKHEGFGFKTSPTGETYMVVECTSGSIGLDTVSLTFEKHANDADYNYYYEHIPFDYDNIDPSIIVYNGGMDTADNNEMGAEDESDFEEEESEDEEYYEDEESEWEDDDEESEETDVDIENVEETEDDNNSSNNIGLAVTTALIIGAIVLFIVGIAIVVFVIIIKKKG